MIMTDKRKKALENWKRKFGLTECFPSWDGRKNGRQSSLTLWMKDAIIKNGWAKIVHIYSKRFQNAIEGLTRELSLENKETLYRFENVWQTPEDIMHCYNGSKEVKENTPRLNLILERPNQFTLFLRRYANAIRSDEGLPNI